MCVCALVQAIDVGFSYSANQNLLNNIDFGVDSESRIALVRILCLKNVLMLELGWDKHLLMIFS